jgi:tetratricopeptide (TPR) repeat protein
MRLPRQWPCLPSIALLLAIPVVAQNSLISSPGINVPNTISSADNFSAAPGQAGSGQQLGDYLMQQHRYQAALAAYESISIPSAQLWSRMGLAHEFLLAFNDAVRCYQESLRLQPNDARVMSNLGTAYDQLGNHRQAERLYRQAISVAPQNAIYFKNLGTNLLAQHEVRKGTEAYRQALALDPHVLDAHDYPAMMMPRADNAQTNYARARSCARAGQTECALNYLRKAIEEGAVTRQKVASDRDFGGMRDDPTLKQLLAANH